MRFIEARHRAHHAQTYFSAFANTLWNLGNEVETSDPRSGFVGRGLVFGIATHAHMLSVKAWLDLNSVLPLLCS